jgi:hypothetical protein
MFKLVKLILEQKKDVRVMHVYILDTPIEVLIDNKELTRILSGEFRRIDTEYGREIIATFTREVMWRNGKFKVIGKVKKTTAGIKFHSASLEYFSEPVVVRYFDPHVYGLHLYKTEVDGKVTVSFKKLEFILGSKLVLEFRIQDAFPILRAAIQQGELIETEKEYIVNAKEENAIYQYKCSKDFQDLAINLISPDYVMVIYDIEKVLGFSGRQKRSILNQLRTKIREEKEL